ncbi:MAG: helix-turn-helix domain-containing protein [Clostridium sp.]|nr:helix-turn-helix domain-containing protein [Clostridium sp.]
MKVKNLCLSVSEAQSVLNLSKGTVLKLIHTNDIPHIRVGRRILIPAKELEQWIQSKSKDSVKGCDRN